MTFDGRSLTRNLLSFSAINLPGDERDCAQFLGHHLEQAGYETRYYELAEKRSTLNARLGASGAKPPHCFTGHLDMAPVSATPRARHQRGFMSCPYAKITAPGTRRRKRNKVNLLVRVAGAADRPV